MRYVQASNFGHGFITHADREILSFSGKPGDMWEIDGPDGAIDIWIAKVSGIEKTLVESDAAQFEATKFLYSTREFFTEALTPSSGWAGRVNEAASRKAQLMTEKERLGRRINEQSIANAQKRQSAEDVKRAGYVARRSREEGANRQAMVEAMMAQGRSPFLDELNNRNRRIYGM